MVITEEQVREVAKKLDYDEGGLRVVIERAGSLAIAYQRLSAKLAQQERFVNRKHEERIAERFAEQARARHARRQSKARDERQADRRSADLARRLADCLQRSATLSAISAVGVAGGNVSTGKKESSPPPAVLNDVVDFYLPRLVALIGNFERDIDAELLGHTAAAEKPEDRDLRIVRDYEGWEAHEVATFDRSVGSAQIVERARRKHGRTAARGYRPPADADAA